MKLKYLFLLLLFVLPSCGDNTDTSGVLSMTEPTVKAVAGATYSSVSYSIMYTPPNGKDPNGVWIHEDISCITSGSSSQDFQLYDNTTINRSFTATNGDVCSIGLSIGTMIAGTTVAIPIPTTTP